MKILKPSIWVSLKNLNTEWLGGIMALKVRQKSGLNTYQKVVNNLPHTPVLLHQVADFLEPEKANTIVDATFGSGGHTRELLKRSQLVKILCLDRDPVAFNYALELQDEYPEQVIPLHGKFSDLPKMLKSNGYKQNSIDGILFDFGSSSMQFDDPVRGFALGKDSPLDMRMDGPNSNSITAFDVLAYASETQLHNIFKIYGEEIHSRKIAKAIVEMRQSHGPIKRTSELRDIVASVFGKNYKFDSSGKFGHISTKIFLSLRMFVNNEMNEISYAMLMAHRYLKIGGVMVTLTLNPTEDKLVKNCISGEFNSPVDTQLPLHLYSFNTTFDFETIEALKNTKWKSLTKHVVVPNRYEITVNPRSRAVKLRACVKVF